MENIIESGFTTKLQSATKKIDNTDKALSITQKTSTYRTRVNHI